MQKVSKEKPYFPYFTLQNGGSSIRHPKSTVSLDCKSFDHILIVLYPIILSISLKKKRKIAVIVRKESKPLNEFLLLIEFYLSLA